MRHSFSKHNSQYLCFWKTCLLIWWMDRSPNKAIGLVHFQQWSVIYHVLRRTTAFFPRTIQFPLSFGIQVIHLISVSLTYVHLLCTSALAYRMCIWRDSDIVARWRGTGVEEGQVRPPRLRCRLSPEGEWDHSCLHYCFYTGNTTFSH